VKTAKQKQKIKIKQSVKPTDLEKGARKEELIIILLSGVFILFLFALE